jgi:hypothetical protein
MAMVKKAKIRAGPGLASIKISELMRPEFRVALAELMNSNLLPVETSWILLQVFEEVSGFQKNFEELRHKLLSKYGQKDAEGNLKMNDKKTEFLLADKAGFDKDYGSLLNLEVQLKQVPLSDVKEARISPVKLSCLVKTVVNPSL